METRRLEQFRVVAETKNLREAASLLHITHAGLAKSIRVLEAELGVGLLSRDGRNIKITPEGKRLLREMAFCLDAEKRLLESARGLDSLQKNRLRLGTFEVFSTYLSPDLVGSLPASTELVFEELIPGALEDALVAEEVDMGISYIAVPKSELDHLEVTKIRMGVFGLKKLGAVKFSELPFVIPVSRVEGTPSKVRGLDGWPDDRIPRLVRYRVTLMETAMALARQGLAAAYLPHFIVERHNRLQKGEFQLQEFSHPLKGSAPQPVYAIKRKSDPEGPA
ncbi:MAG: LysR family transcriptional regulator, partial [Bdellovibrionota bacterium]